MTTSRCIGDPRLPEAFWSKVQHHPVTDCWEWTAATNNKGYGQWAVGQVSRSVHRVTYSVFIGPIPEDLTIDHLCEQKICCNPWHLEIVSSGENSRRYHRGGKAERPRTQRQIEKLAGDLCRQSDLECGPFYADDELNRENGLVTWDEHLEYVRQMEEATP